MATALYLSATNRSGHDAGSAQGAQRTARAGWSWRPWALPVCAFPLLVGLCLPAAGQATPPEAHDDGLTFIGGLGYFHDDNLFRLADGRPGFDGRRSDTARVGTLGLRLNQPYARQRLQLQARLSKVAFSHFDQLDYDGKDVLGQLDWQLGNHLAGKVGATYVQTLAPYTDLFSRERNLRVQRRRYVDGAWRAHPAWRLRAGATRDSFSYELAQLRASARTETAYEAGIDYLARSGSVAGLMLRRVEGDYAQPRRLAAGLIDDSFVQNELKARVDWKVTPITAVEAVAGPVRRRHRAPGRETVSGLNGRVTASFHPRQKLRASTAVWRELAPIESSIVSFSRNTGLRASASLDASAHLRLEASAATERREYEGGPGRIGTPGTPGVRDRLGTATVSANWAPRRSLLLRASLVHQRRRGATFLGNGDFRATTVSLHAQVQF